MPVSDDYRERLRRRITVNLDKFLYEAMGGENLCPLNTRFDLLNYLRGRSFPIRELEIDIADDDFSNLDYKIISFVIWESVYDIYKACATAHRRSLASIVRATLRDRYLGRENPYKAWLLNAVKMSRK